MVYIYNEKRRTNAQDYTAMVHSQDGDLVNIRGLFFLDIGRMPVASQDSIQFHMVSL